MHKGLSSLYDHGMSGPLAAHEVLRGVHRLCTLLCMSEVPERGRVPRWTLGDRLAKALDDGQVSHGEMAELLEVGRNTIGNYCAGRTKPSVATLHMWAARTGVDFEWLRTGVAPHGGGPTPPRGLPDGGDKLRRLTEKSRARARGGPTHRYQVAA
jgi:transcriptional regulator with XRE-family HTH domain